MPAKPNEFHIVTTWQVESNLQEVVEILTDALHLPDWWGEVYLGTKIIFVGDGQGIGRQIAVHSKGWLPYELNWVATLIESDQPHSWKISASGDLNGVGIWSLTQNGLVVEAVYDWRVRADKLILRLLSPLLAPIFAWNHRWAMAKGEAALKRELVRRRLVAERNA
jgi:hypothetical protein